MEAKGETRRRLLDAAGEAFAEFGFRHTTVREICRRADANVAAVNYHFRDKEELYQAVFDEACCVAAEHFPTVAHSGVSSGPRERLHAFIRQYLAKLLSPGRPAWQGKLMAREMMEPTGALDRMVELVVRPNSREMGEIVTEITGLIHGDPRHWMMSASVIAQCLFYAHAKPVIERMRPDWPYDVAMIEEVAEHITVFSWAALTTLKPQPHKAATTKSARSQAGRGTSK
jgi:AcrR family transcriptional regulator